MLITHPILRIGPVRLPPVPWTEKELKARNFSSDTEVIAAAETWLDAQSFEFFFFEWLIKVRATG